MRDLDKKIEEPETQEGEIAEIEEPKLKKKDNRRSKANKTISDIMGGNILTKEGFVNSFPFYALYHKHLYGRRYEQGDIKA